MVFFLSSYQIGIFKLTFSHFIFKKKINMKKYEWRSQNIDKSLSFFFS